MENKKPKKGNRKTYTKEKLDVIINVALLDMQFPFLLAFIGRENIAETMGGLIVTEIVGVFLVYCVKSFFETNAAEKIRIQEEQMVAQREQESEEDIES